VRGWLKADGYVRGKNRRFAREWGEGRQASKEAYSIGTYGMPTTSEAPKKAR